MVINGSLMVDEFKQTPLILPLVREIPAMRFKAVDEGRVVAQPDVVFGLRFNSLFPGRGVELVDLDPLPRCCCPAAATSARLRSITSKKKICSVF